jgi:hypothetical protein
MTTALKRIKIRRATTLEWTATNAILSVGEFGMDTTTNILRLGDGTTPFLSLSPFLTDLNSIATFETRTEFVAWAALNIVSEGGIVEAGGLSYIKRAAFTALPGLPGWDTYRSYLPDHYGAVVNVNIFDSGPALALYWANIAGRGTEPKGVGIYYIRDRGNMNHSANGGGFTADWTAGTIDVSQTGTAGTFNSVVRMHGSEGPEIAMTYAVTTASTNVASTTVTSRDGSGDPVAHGLVAGDDVFLSSLDVFDIGYSALNDKRGQRAVVSTVPSTTTFTIYDAIHDALTTSPVYQKIDYFKDANIVGINIIGSGRFDSGVGDIGINMLWCNNVHITKSDIRYVDYNGIRMDNCTHCTVDKWTGILQQAIATDEFSAHVLFLNGCQDCHITYGLSWGGRHPVDYSSNSRRGIGRNCTVSHNHAYGCFYGNATHGSAVDCTFLHNEVYNSLFAINTRSPGWSIIGTYGANVSEVVRLTLNPADIYVSGTRGKKVNYLVRMAPGIDLIGLKETGNVTILDSQGTEIGDNAINISPELPYFTQADAAVTAASTTTMIVIGALGGFWDANRALEGSYIDIDPDGAGGTGTVTRFISDDTWTGTVHQLTIGAITAPETDATYVIYSGTKMGNLVIDGVNAEGCEFSPVYVKGAWTGGYVDNINAQADAAVAQPVVRVATAVGQRQVGFAIGNNIRYDNYQPPRFDDPALTWRPHMAGIRDGGAFETRAAAVAWIAAGGKIADKEVFRAGNEWYEGETDATDIADMDNVVPYGDDYTVEHFKGASNTDAAALLAALTSANGRPVRGAVGAAYTFATAIEYIGSVNLDLSMSNVTVTANITPITLKASSTGRFNLSADYDVSVTPLQLDVSALPTAPAAGQVIWIASKARDLGNRDNGSTSNQYRTGEAVRLGVGSTTTRLVLARPLSYHLGGADTSTAGDEAVVSSYTTALNAHIVVPDMAAKCNVKLPTITYNDAAGDGDWSATAIRLWAYVNGRVSHGGVNLGYGAAVRVWGTYAMTIEKVAASNLTDNAPSQLGYGIADGGWNTRVVGLSASSLRHAYTSSKASSSFAVETLDAYKAMTFGRTAGAQITGGHATGGASPPWDTHASSDGVIFSGNIAENVASDGFSHRGRNIQVVHPIVRNCKHGVRFFTEYDNGDADEDYFNNGKRLVDFTSGMLIGAQVDVAQRCIDVRHATVLADFGRYRSTGDCVVYNSGGNLTLSGTHSFVVQGAVADDVGDTLVHVVDSNVAAHAAFTVPAVIIDGDVTIDATGYTGSAPTALKSETGTKIIVRGLLRLLLPSGSTLFSSADADIVCEGKGRIEYSITGSSGIVASLSSRPIYLVDLTSGEVMDGTGRTSFYNGYNEVLETDTQGVIVNGAGGDAGVRLRNLENSLSNGNLISALIAETNDASGVQEVGRVQWVAAGSTGKAKLFIQRNDGSGLVDAFSVSNNGDVSLFESDGTTVRLFFDASTGFTRLTAPGVYADDAAAASAGVGVGETYRKASGVMAWRQS